MTYKRWYDADPRLSAVMKALASMNRDSQLYFAEKLLELSESLIAQNGGEGYLERLAEEKKDALDKANAKKRWYDHDERLHQAFNNLYALSGQDRREIAARLEKPIQIVEGYEKHCQRQGNKPEMRIIEEILRSSFLEGHTRTRRLYATYLDEPAEILPPERHQWEQEWSSLLKRFQEALT